MPPWCKLVTRRSKAKRKKGGPLAFLKRAFTLLFCTVCVILAVGFGYVVARVYREMQDLPDITLVERYEPIEAIQIFDRNDKLICTVEGDEDRRVVPLSQVAAQMQQAMLAAEDHHFYEHHGVNFSSVFRASLANLQAHKVVEGGSTITQQLVKNLFFTDAQRTFDRKFKEAYMAYAIETRYPKERILEMYLNQVYFGSNSYGIERAASRYFDRSAATLDLAQSAFLAGLVKAPSELGSPTNRTAAISRQHEILDKMYEYGYVTAAQVAKAKKEKLAFKQGVNPLQKYPYYVSYVLELMRDKFSQSELRRQGLRVYTNLDPQAQEIAEKTLNDAVPNHTPKGVSQAALVSVAVSDGAVIAMVGGVGNYWKHQFNRATNPHTAGSSFKPFVYLTALLKGTFGPDTIVEDTPLVVHQPWGLPDYAPKNFDHRFYGKMPMRRALALSRNVVSVRLAQAVGVDHVVETAREAGITTKLEPNLSLALGSSAVKPIEMAGAYATFARMGTHIDPQVLRHIDNSRGQIVQVFEPNHPRVYPVEPVARLVNMMQDVVKFGTGTQAKLKDRQVAGKTGTADAGKDIWFIGFTTDTCTAVWGGNDENLPIPGQHVTGGDVMARIWRQYMEAYYQARPTPPGEFVPPSAITPSQLAQQKKSKQDVLVNQAMSGSSVTTQTPVEEKVSTGPAGEQVPMSVSTPSEKAVESQPVTAVPVPAPERKAADVAAPAPAPAPAPALTPMPAPAPAPGPSASTAPRVAPISSAGVTPAVQSPLQGTNYGQGVLSPDDFTTTRKHRYAPR